MNPLASSTPMDALAYFAPVPAGAELAGHEPASAAGTGTAEASASLITA